MSELRMIAIASELANKVRETKLSPGYGHPVTAKVATGHGPCRHCLRPFVVGQDVRMLFTLNPFYGVAPIPQPGPVFIHEEECERYVETAGYPAELLPFGVVLDGYDAEQMVRRREMVTDGSQEATIEQMMCDPLIRYVMVRDAKAGCFDLRVEKDNSRSLRDDKQRKDNSRSLRDDKQRKDNSRSLRDDKLKVRVERSEES